MSSTSSFLEPLKQPEISKTDRGKTRNCAEDLDTELLGDEVGR